MKMPIEPSEDSITIVSGLFSSLSRVAAAAASAASAIDLNHVSAGFLRQITIDLTRGDTCGAQVLNLCTCFARDMKTLF